MESSASSVRISGRRAKRKTFDDYIEISDWKTKVRRKKCRSSTGATLKKFAKNETNDTQAGVSVQPIDSCKGNSSSASVHHLLDNVNSFVGSSGNSAIVVKQEPFSAENSPSGMISCAELSENAVVSPVANALPKKRGRKPKFEKVGKKITTEGSLSEALDEQKHFLSRSLRGSKTAKKHGWYNKLEAQQTNNKITLTAGKDFCRKSGCRKSGLACCVQASTSCIEATGKTSRWHHMSLEEHYCNGCFEHFYRGTNSGCVDFQEWKRAWVQNSKIDTCFKNLTTYMSERQLPYWIRCTVCNLWRPVANELELTSDVVRSYTCIMGNLVNTLERNDHVDSEYRDVPHVKYACGEPSDPCVDDALKPDIAWMAMLSYTPYLKRSPAAPFLSSYYPDGVGMSAVDTTCKESATAASFKTKLDDVLRPPGLFDRINIDRSTTAEVHRSGPSVNPSSQTSMLMSPGGRNHMGENQETPVEGLNPYFQPFYKPHERGKALCMRPDVMELDETEEFPEFYKEQTATYLAIRNTVIALWNLDPTRILTARWCCEHLITRGLTRIRLCELVLPRVMNFATRKGLINCGVLGVPRQISSKRSNAPGLLPGVHSRQKVVVVGVGPAGLAAARQLHNFGCEVVCVEARDRLGGRVHDDWTLDGVCVGRGAQIINGCVNNPLALISHQLGLNMHILRPRCDLYDGGDGDKESKKRRIRKSANSPVSAECDKRMDFHFNALLDIITEWRQAQEQDAVDCSLGEKIAEAHKEWIAQSGLSFSKLEERLLNFHIGNLEFACGSSLDKVSAFHWDQNEIFAQFSGEHAFVQYGFGTQLEALAHGLDVRFNLPVKKIDYGNSKILVYAGKDQVFTADRVLLTIPLAVLRSGSIQFQPTLPEEKTAAMNRLGCGCIEKIALQFPYRFWDQKIDGANYFGYVPTASDMRGFCTVFYDVPYPQCEKSNVLMSVISGDSVEMARNMSEEKIKDMALSILADLFPEQEVPKPVNFFVTRWRDDPFAQMAYSYVHTGSSGDDYDELAKDVGDKLFFAGEGTNRHFPQTVTGAYLSGLREAAKITASRTSAVQRASR